MYYNRDILFFACLYSEKIPLSRHSLIVNSTGGLQRKWMCSSRNANVIIFCSSAWLLLREKEVSD